MRSILTTQTSTRPRNYMTYVMSILLLVLAWHRHQRLLLILHGVSKGPCVQYQKQGLVQESEIKLKFVAAYHCLEQVLPRSRKEHFERSIGVPRASFGFNVPLCSSMFLLQIPPSKIPLPGIESSPVYHLHCVIHHPHPVMRLVAVDISSIL